MNRTTILAALTLTAAAIAQATETSPAGLLSTPGDTSVTLGPLAIGPFPVSVWRHFTQIDASQPVVPRTITALSFRRPTIGSGAVGGTAQIAVRMAHADYSLVTSGATVAFDTLRTSPWVDVFTQKPVVLPVWSQPGNPPPAAFDLRLPLDTPFAFNGQDALMYQVLMDGVAIAIDATDRTSVVTPIQNYGVGLGCTVGTQEMGVSASWRVYTDPAQGIVFSVGANPGSGVLNQMAVAGLGFSPVNLPIPGVCAPLLTSAEGSIYMLAGFAFGTYRTANFTLPYSPALVGQYDLYVQAWARLTGQPQPFVGSYGTRTGPIPAPRSDGFQAALHDEALNGFAFQTTGFLVKNRAAIVGIE